MKTSRLTALALLSAIALSLFVIELQIPPLTPVPGIKLGLANIVTVFVVFAYRGRDGALVLAVRVFLGALFSGNFGTIIYSAAGGALAILATVGLKRILTKKQLWVAGALGAVAHSFGQMGAAIALSGTPALALYLPVRVACSVVTGIFTGLCAQILLNRGEKLWKTTLE